MVDVIGLFGCINDFFADGSGGTDEGKLEFFRALFFFSGWVSRFYHIQNYFNLLEGVAGL